MNSTAVSSRSCISAISRTIRAWMVTSSAVVGSSAMTSFGLLAKQSDQHALAHAAGELMRIARQQLGGTRQMHRLERREHGVAPLARRDTDARQVLVELAAESSAPD
jgi:hypothetical protein